MMACQADQRWTTRKSSKISARMTAWAVRGPVLAVGLALLAGIALLVAAAVATSAIALTVVAARPARRAT